MPSSIARVPTENASRYLAQLCKHFAHKVPAEWSRDRGKVEFVPGACRMQANDKELLLDCESANAEDLEVVKHTVRDHLVRFGWREELQVEWNDKA